MLVSITGRNLCKAWAFHMPLVWWWHDTNPNKGCCDMLSSAHAKGKADNRKAPYTILSTLCFLACQSLPLRGNYLSNTGGESHFMQLLRLHMEDVPILNAWLQKAQGQFMSPIKWNKMTQNELLQNYGNDCPPKNSCKYCWETIFDHGWWNYRCFKHWATCTLYLLRQWKSPMKISLPCTAWIPQKHRVLHTQ